jgi:hypothetical protein
MHSAAYAPMNPIGQCWFPAVFEPSVQRVRPAAENADARAAEALAPATTGPRRPEVALLLEQLPVPREPSAGRRQAG